MMHGINVLVFKIFIINTILFFTFNLTIWLKMTKSPIWILKIMMHHLGKLKYLFKLAFSFQ